MPAQGREVVFVGLADLLDQAEDYGRNRPEYGCRYLFTPLIFKLDKNPELCFTDSWHRKARVETQNGRDLPERRGLTGAVHNCGNACKRPIVRMSGCARRMSTESGKWSRLKKNSPTKTNGSLI